MHVVPTDGNPQLPGAVEVNLPFQPRLHNLLSKILTYHFPYQPKPKIACNFPHIGGAYVSVILLYFVLRSITAVCLLKLSLDFKPPAKKVVKNVWQVMKKVIILNIFSDWSLTIAKSPIHHLSPIDKICCPSEPICPPDSAGQLSNNAFVQIFC